MNEKISYQKAKDKLENYFEISPGIIGIVNIKNGYFTECNLAVTRILGYSIEEFTSKPLIELIHPDDREKATEEIVKVLHGGVTRNFHNRYQCKDGSYKWLSWEGTTADINGNTHVIATDITEHMRMEVKLREQEALYRSVVQDLPALVCRFKPNGLIKYVNDAYCHYFGKSRDDLIGSNFLSLIPKNDRDFIRTNLLALNQKKAIIQHEHQVIGHNGEIRWQRWTNRAICDEQGLVVMIQAFGEDITDSKEIENKLIETNEQLTALVKSSPSSIVALDPEGNIILWNPAAEKIYGWEEKEVMGLFPPFIPGHKKGEFQTLFNQVLEGEGLSNVEVKRSKKDGSDIVVSLSTAPLRDATGCITGIFSIGTDITEKKRKETELIEHQILLKEAQSIAHMGNWELDSQTQKAIWSEEMFNIFGINPTDDAGPELLATLLHPDDKEQVLSSLHCAIFDGKKHHLEYRIVRPDGKVRWVECEAMQLRDDTGKIVKLRGIFKDISEHKKIEQELSNTLATLKNVIDSTPDLIFVKNHQLQTILCNKAYSKAVDKTCEQMIGNTDIENGWDPKLVNGDPDKGIRGFKHDDRDALSGIKVNNPYDPANVHGEVRIFDTYKLPLKDAKDKIIGMLGVSRDITERKQTEDRLKLLSNVFIHASEGISITGANGNILDVNEAFTHITGYSREEIIGKNPKILQSGVHDRAFYKAMWQEINEKGNWYGEIWNRRKNGDIYAEKININVVKDAEGEVQNYIAIFSDITSIKKHQEHLEHMAHYDALTNLPNRTLLSNRLAKVIAQSNRNADHLTIAYLDLDGFKEVNDTHGHAVGDQLLVSVTDNLKQHLRDGDILARIGGDEFVAVLSNIGENNHCIPLLQRLLDSASKPIPIDKNILHISASIGVTFFPQDEKIDADQLLRQADQAMYIAKQSGKNCYKIFDMSQEQYVRQRHESIGRIHQALENNEFVMFYQPKVNMRCGEVTGFEALIRWLHPEKGLLPPIEFLPLIEDDFISVKLGDWVISNTLSQLNKWHQSGLKTTISINISALHLQQPSFVKSLEHKLKEYPEIENGYLELEILETSALDDINQVSKIMNMCHQLGVHFALDDFGTGYSSLTYLKRLPASTLKIDQTFVRDMMNDPDDLAIIEGILGLSSAFKRQPIAEGVETLEHGRILLKLGCDFAQGYSIAKPMPSNEVIDWVANWQHPDEWKDVKRVDRENVSLLYATVEQKVWVKSLELYVQDKTIALPVGIEECRFGKWLEQTGKQKYGQLSTFKQVDLAHRQLHDVAHQVLKYNNQNDNKKLLDELSLLKQISTELLNLFENLFES